MEVFTSCEICFFCWSRSLNHPVVVHISVVVNSCCWQGVKQIQMKVLWSKWTSHLFEPPWINDQGKEVQTIFCNLLSRSSAWSQEGRQFFPRGQAHPGRECSKALVQRHYARQVYGGWKKRVRYSHLMFRLVYQSFRVQKLFSGRAWSKMDLT